MADARRAALLAKIREYWGCPYVFGGKSPETSFDCSGLLTYCARAVGLDLGDPNYTSADGLRGHSTPVVVPLPGDLVLFHTTYGTTGPNYATHCGVVNGPGTMLDTHDGVHETNAQAPYWQAHLMGYWRPSRYDDVAIEEDAVKIAELETRLGYCQGDVADALQAGLEGAVAATTPEAQAAAYEAIQSAINSLRNT